MLHILLYRKANATSYVYNYKYRHSFMMYPSWVNGSHIDDLYSVFGEPFLEVFRSAVLGDYNDDDKRMRDIVQNYYHNFAHNG